jgi:hypothetical protein
MVFQFQRARNFEGFIPGKYNSFQNCEIADQFNSTQFLIYSLFPSIGVCKYIVKNFL